MDQILFELSMDRPTWLLLGDSLTQRGTWPGGWTGKLANVYVRAVDFLNRGYSGYNTRWVLYILPRILGTCRQVQLMTIWLGANDACIPDGISAAQHVPLEEYADNLVSIVNHARRAGIQRLLLLTPPPVDRTSRAVFLQETRGTDPSEIDRTAAITQEYARTAAAVAKGLGLPCLDSWNLVSAVPSWEKEVLCDGLHFSARGQELVASWALDAIAEHWPDLTPERIPKDCPELATVNAKYWQDWLDGKL